MLQAGPHASPVPTLTESSPQPCVGRCHCAHFVEEKASPKRSIDLPEVTQLVTTGPALYPGVQSAAQPLLCPAFLSSLGLQL